MYKDDENRNVIGAEVIPRDLIRRPKILARRVARKKCPNPPSSIEIVESNPQQSSVEKEESGNGSQDILSSEAIFGCAALDETLQKHQPFPVTEHVPVSDSSQLRMRFGDEEDVSDRVRMIGVALAERALKALRTVPENESCFQFTSPREAAKVNLNSADDPASVSQILSGSHPVEQDNLPSSSRKPPRSPIILRITRTKSGGRKVSTNYHTCRQLKGKADVITNKEMTEDYDSRDTSLECGSSLERKEGDTDAMEHLTPEEEALVDQVLLLCRQFIRSINYDEANWYSKLKKAIYLRLQQQVDDMKNTMSRRRELRERNEELRRLHQHLTEQNRCNEPQSALEEVLASTSIDNLDPQQSE